MFRGAITVANHVGRPYVQAETRPETARPRREGGHDPVGC